MIEANNKIVFITGGAKGIGAGIVRKFLQKEAKFVAFLDIDKKSGRELESLMREGHGDKVKFIECDVTNDDQLLGAYESVFNDNGCIDVVINLAGIAKETKSAYKKLIDINYKAVVTSTLKALEIMRTDHGGRGGTIINISSIAALSQACPTYFVYAGSKSAVLQFSNGIGLQDYYCRTGVRVLTVSFGYTNTTLDMESFDPFVSQHINNILKNILPQSVESAAQGLMEAFQTGNSGDTWVVTNNKPAMNITDRVKKAYDIMSEGLFD